MMYISGKGFETYAALILLRFAGGWPSVLTKRIGLVFGGRGTAAGDLLLDGETMSSCMCM